MGEFLASTYERITSKGKFSEFKQQKIFQKVNSSRADIAICMQNDLQERAREWEEVAAIAMAVQNIWLQLEELEPGGYWSTPGTKEFFEAFYDLP